MSTDGKSGQGGVPTRADAGYSRRTLGLGIFFLVASAGAIVVWWLALHSPFAITKLYEHYTGIDELADSVEIGFFAIAGVCLAVGLPLLLIAAIQARRRRAR